MDGYGLRETNVVDEAVIESTVTVVIASVVVVVVVIVVEV